MAVEPAGQNAVVVANLLNLTIFTPAWIVSQKIIAAEDIQPGAVMRR
jgi:hypothetical protein